MGDNEFQKLKKLAEWFTVIGIITAALWVGGEPWIEQYINEPVDSKIDVVAEEVRSLDERFQTQEISEAVQSESLQHIKDELEEQRQDIRDLLRLFTDEPLSVTGAKRRAAR